MEIKEQILNIETSGVLEQGAFQIKTTAAAFQLLSSGLYSNKIKAVIRELSCNAVDAHTSVSKRYVPIEVKIPNRLDNQFYVKDFGPGLSHDQIMSMYTTYFDSTKQKSNDFIGGFGIGSKSPFAYTDAFTVESRHGGMNRIYSAFIGEDGSPKIAMLSENELEDKNDTGLSVSMPVKPEDFSAFSFEAERLFQWFDVTPNIKGTALNIKKEKISEITTTNMSGVFIRMGQIVYPVKLNAVKPEDRDFLSEHIDAIQSFGAVLTAPVGKYTVAASREELSFDKKTIESLKEDLPKAVKNLYQKIVDQLEACDLKTFDGRKDALKIMRDHNLSYSSNSWRSNSTSKIEKILTACGVQPSKYKFSLYPSIEGRPELEKIRVISPYSRYKIHEWINLYSNTVNELNSEHYTFVKIDMNTSSSFADKARRLLVDSVNNNIVVIQPKDKTTDTEYQQSVDSLFDYWGLNKDKREVKNLSDYLNPSDKAKYIKSGSENSVSAWTFFSNKQTICHNDHKKCYYVLCDSSKEPKAPDFDTDSPWYNKRLAYEKLMLALKENTSVAKEFLTDLGADVSGLSRVYMISALDEDIVKKFPNVQPIHKIIEEGIRTPEFLTKWNSLPVHVESHWRSFNNFYSSAKNDKDLYDQINKSQAGQFIEWLNKGQKFTKEDNAIKTTDTQVQYAYLGRKVNAALADANLPVKMFSKENVQKYMSRYYPLIDISTSYNMEQLQEVAAYINWKDQSHKQDLMPGVTTRNINNKAEINYEN